MIEGNWISGLTIARSLLLYNLEGKRSKRGME